MASGRAMPSNRPFFTTGGGLSYWLRLARSDAGEMDGRPLAEHLLTFGSMQNV